jgi:radical SAM superfamily enzyme YgiQ (UPF0313 family)
MKIAFVKPNMITGKPADSMEPLVFAILAALTPSRIERCLYDDRTEEIPYDAPVDLVALTADAFTAKRAYQIAGEYRKRGVPVVLGGFHPTLCPEEASRHADSMVLGDAEDTWPQVVADAEAGTLQKRYVSSFGAFGQQEPDRTLFRGRSYAPIRLVEYNRGCRFACEFCSIRAMYRGSMRRKALEDVVRDIDASRHTHIFFTDDNFHADRVSLERVLHKLTQRKCRWSCQISADIVKHPDMVALMARAGCVSVTIGFESLERSNLEQMGKSWMADDYKRIIAAFHDNGIMVYGTFIIGYDSDTPAIFERTLEFALENRLFLANFNPLTPTPGTPLYQRLQSQGRLRFEAWWLNDDYRWGDCLFRPARMSAEELTSGCFELRKAFNSARNIIARFPGLKLRHTNLYKAGLYVAANRVSRRELHRKYGQALGDVSSADASHHKRSGVTVCT